MGKKVYFQSEKLYLKKSGAVNGTNKWYLFDGVQSLSTSLNIQRETHSRLGRYSPFKWRRPTQDPTIKVEFSYVPSHVYMEHLCGFDSPVSAVKEMYEESQENGSFLDGLILVQDLLQTDSLATPAVDGDAAAICLMDGLVENYSLQASVGQAPQVSVGMEFLEIGIDNQWDGGSLWAAATEIGDDMVPNPGSQWPLPENTISTTLESDFPVFGPQDIEITFPTNVFGFLGQDEKFYLQSFSLSLPLSRRLTYKIGKRKPELRTLEAPIQVSVQASIIIGGWGKTTDGTVTETTKLQGSKEWQDLVCGDFLEGNFEVYIWCPWCGDVGDGTRTKDTSDALIHRGDGNYIIKHVFTNPYLDDWRISNSVGGTTTLDLTFTSFINADALVAETLQEGNYLVTFGSAGRDSLV